MVDKTTFSEEEICSILINPDLTEEQEHAIKDFMFKEYQNTIGIYQKRYKLSDLDIDTAYRESIDATIKNIKHEKYEKREGKSLKAYFSGIMNNKSRKISSEINKDKLDGIYIDIEEVYNDDRISATIYEHVSDLEELAIFYINQMTPKCKKKLMAIEIDQMRKEDAWEFFNYKGIEVFRAAYAKCRSDLKNAILIQIRKNYE